MTIIVPGNPKAKGRHHSGILKRCLMPGCGRKTIQKQCRCGNTERWEIMTTIEFADKETVSYENLVRLYSSMAMKESNQSLIEGPVQCEITAYFMIPESRACKKHYDSINPLILGGGRIDCKKVHIGDYSWSHGRNDFDNIAKSVCDGMKGIVWRDDGQIAHATVIKRYSDQPRVEIEVKQL